ncbi:MAG: hypothetical protein IRZ10_03720 [Thermoflavifilum sp.]|nr:hypothetical protein [Thermoflavifilum sp.]MCL6513502.1 hypothetical protein [Alicyclobacillus sp.]
MQGERTILRQLKVPEITAYFWIIKLLSTALGESTSDYLVYHINPYLAVISAGIVFLAALVWQFAVRRYVAGVYWFLVVMVAVFGTMVADAIHIVLGIPYIVSTLVFALVLIVVFTAWYRVEGTLSVHSILTARREAFYWAAVLATFAMGTATGDLTATTFRLGYLSSGILFLILFAVPGLYYAVFRRHEVFCFWFAYIMTRPLGASFADWMGKPHIDGGLSIGDGTISAVLLVLIILLVGYLGVTHRDVQRTPAVRAM